jgi:hydroxymethylglutaryl-CoA reductase
VKPGACAASSRIPRFYERSLEDRVRTVCEIGGVSAETRAHLMAGGGLHRDVADGMIENVIGTFGLPLGVALNFLIDGRDVLVPIAVEEPSVVAAASNAAKMVRGAGGFIGDADAPIMTAQVQLDDVPDPAGAAAKIRAAEGSLKAAGDASIPSMVARGGGVRSLETRVVDAPSGLVVVHVHVDVGEAMGANLVDTVAEAIAGDVLALLGGQMGLRILTNLPLQRRVRVVAEAHAGDVGGDALCDGIARASRFAELDPFRAVTHNKGFMNGLDAAAVALGQDVRAIEAGAHAYAALGPDLRNGGYRPLAVWRRTPNGLRGEAELPLAVGTVGGSARAHAGARAALDLTGARSSRELAIILAAAGLASNLAALRALAGEGIQKGHMRLHRRKDEERACDASRAEGARP